MRRTRVDSVRFCVVPGARPPVARHLARPIDPATLDEIERLTASHRTLEDVARWALSHEPPRVFAGARKSDATMEDQQSSLPGFDLVVQDEYTHDVALPWGMGDLHLVYDTT